MDDGSIRLKVAPEVSSLDYTNAITISGFTMPAISDSRRAETEIELKDGQSFGIAGSAGPSRDHATQQSSRNRGHPHPGRAFQVKEHITARTRELIVLVTPTIVDPVAGHLPASQPTGQYASAKS